MNVAAGNFDQRKNDLAAMNIQRPVQAYCRWRRVADRTSASSTTVSSASYACGTYVSLRKLDLWSGGYGASNRIGDVTPRHLEGQTHQAAAIPSHIDVV